ncbi:hydantoinase/oxoprolinase family protein [Rhodococcus sp. NPDC003382]|uniref:hydantoinase/oxoprolinase family protein n=1 Tax=unclassified Rhodococcus (in: high G+C Gram-positive bacteria) TaxID=192944 RepID=UPI0018CF68CE|nr:MULTISPECIES: hydantoinase/oxoprolinase family protein [unclassified Rhodococcus (in: high G+C Gram-positive bacteria)]MBH0123730.1 hydantoinase/oxoprolinase family protein [Rhodococcus sp. CX]MCK8671154.1 hydantoinase/oxoprolinase family protein [Rhodococcus sp. HM1]
MDRLINIDNGGTLTDICAWDGHDFSFTKTLTTPFDLSQCLFDGLTKVSREIYGTENLPELLHSTAHIRYSTTQGTNALVERKGPSVGILTDSAGTVDELRRTPEQRALFDDLVGSRVAVIDSAADDLDSELVAKVNRLITDGAARIVVAVGDTNDGREREIRRVLLRKFPRHLLGSVPFLYSWDFSTDRTASRRIWSAVINTFLHPTIERFLYNTEHRLRDHRVRNPLLIYRNDGASSRVAKSVALKTYSSGPRGGLEGTRALAEVYGLKHVLMIDVGGTTTDIGTVTGGEILTDRRGSIAGIPISFPMSNVESAGIGGSSVIAVTDGVITVGPESVGAAPGPACFGFGGTAATITDVNLLLGVLDPSTYLDGGFTLDADRARAVVRETVAEPLGLTLDEALIAMEQAYFTAMGSAIAPAVQDADETTIAAFGGAGPMSACGAARDAGVRTVLIPKLAAVFSAFGIGFSDIGQSYETDLVDTSDATLADATADLLAKAERDMFQEGHSLDECTLSWTVASEDEHGVTVDETPYRPGEPVELVAGASSALTLVVTRRMNRIALPDSSFAEPCDPQATGVRTVLGAAGRAEVPVYTLTEQQPGATAEGPAIVEGPFFTARVQDGWTFHVTAGGDLLLTDTH